MSGNDIIGPGNKNKEAYSGNLGICILEESQCFAFTFPRKSDKQISSSSTNTTTNNLRTTETRDSLPGSL
ncbi:unnamed protein product, partial [Heterobilharzia americana]